MNATFRQSRQLDQTPQLLEVYLRRGRELRAEAIARGLRRWLATLKQLCKRAASDADSPNMAVRV